MNLNQIYNMVFSFGVFAILLTHLSGILVCSKYVKNRTTGESTALTFIFGVISSLQWMFYCYTSGDSMIYLHILGFLLMILYTAIFFVYATKKHSVIKQILAMCVVVAIFFIYVRKEEDVERLTHVTVISAYVFMDLMIAAPLVSIERVVKSRNASSLPFPLIIMSLVFTSTFLAYGILDLDYYIAIPCSIGAGLTSIQLCLYFALPKNEENRADMKKLIV